MEPVFAGTPVDLTAPDVLWLGDFRPTTEIPPPVRHAAGYESFAALVASTGAEPAALAGDVRQLVTYLRQHRAVVEAAGEDVMDSAGVFLGNSLIARVEDARWQRWAGSELEVTQGRGGVEVLGMVRTALRADEDRMHEFDDFLHIWDGNAAAQRAQLAAEAAVDRELELMHAPSVPAAGFDAPADASLVELLRALIDYLTAHYEATATSRAAVDDDPRTISPTVETICVRPASPTAAPFIIAVDDVGAIALRAGAFNDFYFYGPDEAALERTLLAIAAGLYREAYLPEANGIGGYRLGDIDQPGGSTARGPVDLPDEKATLITEQLQTVPDGWTSWPLRAALTR